MLIYQTCGILKSVHGNVANQNIMKNDGWRGKYVKKYRYGRMENHKSYIGQEERMDRTGNKDGHSEWQTY